MPPPVTTTSSRKAGRRSLRRAGSGSDRRDLQPSGRHVPQDKPPGNDSVTAGGHGAGQPGQGVQVARAGGGSRRGASAVVQGDGSFLWSGYRVRAFTAALFWTWPNSVIRSENSD